MIGPIRDQETAGIAARAALVSGLVLSTLHVKSPDVAVACLLDLGMERYSVDAVLIGALGQSLEVEKEGGLRFDAQWWAASSGRDLMRRRLWIVVLKPALSRLAGLAISEAVVSSSSEREMTQIFSHRLTGPAIRRACPTPSFAEFDLRDSDRVEAARQILPERSFGDH